ncbi:MAG TPA: tetratricopeptide repeat protein, partial [Abditibacteriaceae bacterium]
LRRYEQALAQYRSAQNATESTTEKAELATRAGYALLELGRIEDSETELRRAVELVPQNSQPLLALASLELSRNRSDAALEYANRAVALKTGDSAPITLRGLAQLRGVEGPVAAAQTFESALEMDARDYQAHSWLAIARLAQDDIPGAQKEAREAVRLEPNSALAQGNLGLVLFFAGESRDAKRAAERAVGLDAFSVAARVTLAQTLLAQGEVDAAAETAAQAVALDPALPQAHYVLGIADAGRRDYTHAERALKQARRLAPDYLAAASALARVYNAMGRPQLAVTTLEELLPRHRQTDAVQGALGAVYYEQANYPRAIEQFRAALKAKPNSALYNAELARTLLYSNDLRGAIEAGQNAVRLAPNIGQYHAILGVAYSFSGLNTQAERELREARTRDPQNALALAQLAYAYAGNDARIAAVNFTQGFLLDPAVSRQLLRGGIDTEITPLLGNEDRQNLNLIHRRTLSDGAMHEFGFLGRNSADNSRAAGNDRANDDSARYDIAEFVTWTPDAKTNLYFNARGRKSRSGLSGSDSAPDDDDRASFRFAQAQIAGRRRLAARTTLWLGVFGNTSNNEVRNPDLDSFVSPNGVPIQNQRFRTGAIEPEMRLDFNLGQTPSRPSVLTVGAGYASTDFRDARRLIGAAVTADQNIDSEKRLYFGYAQLAQRVNDRLSFSAQLRAQRSRVDSRETLVGTGINVPAVESTSSRTRFLPSVLATYQADPKTTLRFYANRRVGDATASTFAPAETLITTESGVQPFGTPDILQLLQFDVERYVGKNGLVKVFAFDARAKSVQIGGTNSFGFGGALPAAGAPELLLDSWRARGVGARYEHQLGRNLFANAGYLVRDTSSNTRGPAFDRIFSGDDAPYEPRSVGNLDLNYVDGKGHKIGLGMRRVGGFFADGPNTLGRPRFPAQTYFDLKLAHEPS